jgi:hypothetical protein
MVHPLAFEPSSAIAPDFLNTGVDGTEKGGNEMSLLDLQIDFNILVGHRDVNL